MIGRLLAGVLAMSILFPSYSFGAARPTVAGDSGYLNMWVDDHYKTCHWVRRSYDSTFTNDQCAAGTPKATSLNDKLSSFVNKTSSWWVLYEDSHYGGARVCVRPNSHDDNIGNDTSYEDDISSVEKLGTSRPAHCTDVTGSPN